MRISDWSSDVCSSDLQTDEQFEAMLDVHVTAPFRILRAAAEPWRAMAKQEAAEGREVIRKVVNISSMAGTHGNAGQVNYSSAKAAVTGMTKDRKSVV